MKVNKIIATAVVSALFAIESWTLKSVVEVKVAITALSVRVDDLSRPLPKSNPYTYGKSD